MLASIFYREKGSAVPSLVDNDDVELQYFYPGVGIRSKTPVPVQYKRTVFLVQC